MGNLWDQIKLGAVFVFFVFRMEDLGQLQMVVVVMFGFFALGNLIWASLGASERLKYL